MKRILVADDSVTIQKVIALTFADEPYEVTSVGSGAEAVEKIKESRPDIVLADVIMPQMNGYELCRAIKENAETGGIPVLLLAGTFEAFDETEAKSVGADDFITKPFESGELIEKVKVLVDVESAAAPPPAEAAPPAPEPPTAPVRAQPQPEAAVPAPPAQPSAAAPSAAPATAPPPATDLPPSSPEAEPDIWDILSDGLEEGTPADSDEVIPDMGQMEDSGVVDVGSFEVGLDRPDVAAGPVVRQSDTLQGQPAQPEAAPPVPTVDPAPPPASPPADPAGEMSLEGREKDFFGFETDLDEAASAAYFMEDAVEEVSFDMEAAPAAPPADQEASFVAPVPPPAQATGDTISPAQMAPDEPVAVPPAPPQPAAAPEISPVAPPQPEPEPMIPVPEQMFDPVPGPAETVDILPEPDPQPVAPQPAATAVEPPPAPEPTPPAPEPAPVAPEPAPAAPDAAAALGVVQGVDEATRRIIEEKVEKIAWEVVPEVAEVMIREVLDKIKGEG